MSNDIRDILKRLALVEGQTTPVSVKHGLNAQQKSAGQLPALFRPRDISPTLTKKPYQKHPMDGKLVGDSMEPKKNPLEEAMQEVEEDMLSRVKGQFRDYLDTLEKKAQLDQHLVRKAKAELNIDDDPETEDKEVEEQDATWDSDVAPISGPADAEDTETAHGIEDHVAQAMSQPTAPVGETITDTDRGVEILGKALGPARVYEMSDGTCVECWGDDQSGYELRRGDRTLPTRFPRLDHADMAMRLFQKRRESEPQDQNQDYIEER